jgi:hypothetical protein
MSHGKLSGDVPTGRAVTQVPGTELTPTEARNAQAHHALLAELYAHAYAQAMSGRRYTAAARLQRKYRRAARSCRVLGELMRRNATKGLSVDGAERTPVDLSAREQVRARREPVRHQRAA